MVQMGLAGILVISLFQPALIFKGLWLFFALPTVLLGMARERSAQLETGPASTGESLVAESVSAMPPRAAV